MTASPITCRIDLKVGQPWRLLPAVLLAIYAALLGASPASARVERLAIHSPAIEGNLEGNSAERRVYVILPPSYDSATERHYPVLYFLHGFLMTADNMMGYVQFDAALRDFATKKEMIVVVPDSHTLFGGSMYTNSPTTGDFEDYIAHDLVHYIDGHFRTIARREARGLAGHSMGGYGTLRIGMHHPDEFVALYAMNPCCLLPRTIETADARFEEMTLDEAKAGDFMTMANFAVATAWSPDPGKPPFFADLATKGGKPVPFVLAQWAANAPTAMAAQYLPALRSMKAIALETGDADFVQADVIAMHKELIKLGVTHDWELYVGDHGNKVPERFGSKVLPFFAEVFAGVDQ